MQENTAFNEKKDITLNDKQNTKKKTLPLIVITVVLILWAFDFIGIEYMMKYMPSGVYTMMRLIVGSTILLAISFAKNGGLHVNKKDWPRLFICGVCAMSLYLTIEGIGVQMTSASFGSLILATVPIFGMIGDRIFFKRKITPLKIVCIAISIVGVYLLVAGDVANSKVVGLIVILIAAMIWAFQIAYMKPLYDKYDLLTILTGIFVSAAVFQLPITAVTMMSEPHIELTPVGILITIVTTVLCLVLGEAGYVYAIGNLSVTVVSAFENLLPAVTIILSFLIYGTMLAPMQLVGAALIIGTVMCIALKD